MSCYCYYSLLVYYCYSSLYYDDLLRISYVVDDGNCISLSIDSDGFIVLLDSGDEFDISLLLLVEDVNSLLLFLLINGGNNSVLLFLLISL